MCQTHPPSPGGADSARGASRAGEGPARHGPAASRRAFLGSAGLLGLGAAAAGAASATPAAASTIHTARPTSAAPAGAAAPGVPSAAGRWNPDPESPRFTLAVMPDTQYMFDATTSVQPAPVAASFAYLLNNDMLDNVVFLAHLGDITENNGLAGEFPAAGATFTFLDRHHMAYSVLAGNHDVDPNTTDQRGDTPYLDTFGPQRFAGAPTFGGADATGYNTYHVFHAAGREWLVLAMDWRASAEGFAWANQIIAQHPKTPVILTTHEIAYSNPNGSASLSTYGQQVWDELIYGNDQVFLTLNGHYWPPGRTAMANKAGHEVQVHITNYQNRYYGGGGMLRLYHFDLARNSIDVETVNPWILDVPAEKRDLLQAQEAELSGMVDYFSLPMDFKERFSGFDPIPAPRPIPASKVVIPGTLAYWRFDHLGASGTPFPANGVVSDRSGNGNDLTLVTVPGSAPSALTFSDDHMPGQPAHASLLFGGGQNPLHGSYLQTVSTAPLNKETFASGYTFEAFFKVPSAWNQANNSWQGIVSRWGMSSQAGATSGDPNEPVATLSLSDDHGLQWCIYPVNLHGPLTNWGHELPFDTWWHVAVVNDGNITTMYVDGCPVGRNPNEASIGITSLGYSWLLGGYEYAGTINQIFNGWIGDVRIVNRPLAVTEFMIPDFTWQ